MKKPDLIYGIIIVYILFSFSLNTWALLQIRKISKNKNERKVTHETDNRYT